MTDKERFIRIYRDTVKREGADKVLAWLEKRDFFTAPASTKYHLAEEGGLCRHSLNVYDAFKKLVTFAQTEYGILTDVTDETVAICALLHDVCKVDFYKTEMRNSKVDGVWKEVPYYTIEEDLPFGHGEKSVYILSAFMHLTREEALAIRWHMGSWQEGEARDAGAAFGRFPLALMLHFADMTASNIAESFLAK